MQPEKQGMTEEYRMYSPCPPSVPVSVPIPILHILPPVPPVSASYSFSNPSDRENRGCRRKTGIQREYGHRSHDAGDGLHDSAKTAQETASSRSSTHKRNVRIFPVRKHFAHEKKSRCSNNSSFLANINFLN